MQHSEAKTIGVLLVLSRLNFFSFDIPFFLRKASTKCVHLGDLKDLVLQTFRTGGAGKRASQNKIGLQGRFLGSTSKIRPDIFPIDFFSAAKNACFRLSPRAYIGDF